MTRGILVAIALLGACATQNEPLPSCASLGCPIAPWGTDDPSKPWEPCHADVCFCRSPDGSSELLACTPPP